MELFKITTIITYSYNNYSTVQIDPLFATFRDDLVNKVYPQVSQISKKPIERFSGHMISPLKSVFTIKDKILSTFKTYKKATFQLTHLLIKSKPFKFLLNL